MPGSGASVPWAACQSASEDDDPPRAPVPGLPERAPPLDPKDITDQRDQNDSRERNEPVEPTEPKDRNEPTDPMDRAEPMEPIERTEPLEQIDSTEPSDQSDQRDPEPCASVIFPSWATIPASSRSPIARRSTSSTVSAEPLLTRGLKTIPINHGKVFEI
jgi:hypothetical protein